MPTILSIRAALDAALATIKIANGYSTDVEADWVLMPGANKNFRREEENAYVPKVFRTYLGSQFQEMPGSRTIQTCLFEILVSLTVRPEDTPQMLEDRILALEGDFVKFRKQHPTLGGARQVVLANTATDAGYSYPEAVLVVHLSIEFDKTV